MGLFWATFLGLVLWAVGRLFSPGRVADAASEEKRETDDAHDLDLRLARRELDVTEYRARREQLTSTLSH